MTYHTTELTDNAVLSCCCCSCQDADAGCVACLTPSFCKQQCISDCVHLTAMLRFGQQMGTLYNGTTNLLVLCSTCCMMSLKVDMACNMIMLHSFNWRWIPARCSHRSMQHEARTLITSVHSTASAVQCHHRMYRNTADTFACDHCCRHLREQLWLSASTSSLCI